jgi:hypothetical protein
MTTTYSPSLKLALIGTGDQSGVWGATTNTNLGTLLEQAITGVNAISLTGLTSYTLTNLNGVSDDARNAVLIFTGSPSATVTIVAPAQNKFYVVANNTSQALSMTATGGAVALTIPANTTAQCYCDAYNVSGNGIGFYSAQTSSAGNQNINGNLSVVGTSSFTGSAIMSTLTAIAISATSVSATSITGTLTGSATSATSASNITNSGGWNITPSGTKLYFNYNGSNVASLDSSGNLITLGSHTAGGTP